MTFEGMDTAAFVGSTGTRGANSNSFVGCYWEGNTVNRRVYANADNTMFTGSFVTGGSDIIDNSSTIIIDGGQTRMFLPNPGEWQVTMASGVSRPKLISKNNFSAFDLIDNLGNNVTIGTIPQVSSAYNYLTATYNNNASYLWECGTAGFAPGDDNLKTLGRTGSRWANVFSGITTLIDGVTAPSTIAGHAQIYVDSADGDLKVKFGDGTVKTLTTDT